MGTWGTAGASAGDGYLSAASRRKRLTLRKWALVLACPAAGWLTYTDTHGRARLIILGLLGVVLVAAALWHPDPDTERWLRGSAGEVGTASLLEGLSRQGWHVFHDLAVPGSRANIDHLAVGRTGVWVIDTKTTRAPVRVRLVSVRLGDRRLPTESVRWQAEVVSDRLGLRARPVIALHCSESSYRSGGSPDRTGRPPDRTGLPRRGVRRGGVRIVLAADLARRLRRGRRRLDRISVESVAGDVLSVFQPAAGHARQNEACRPKRSGRHKRRHGPPTA